ncbi:MAG: sigma factor, partial [Gammaproteobacteria bacterium]
MSEQNFPDPQAMTALADLPAEAAPDTRESALARLFVEHNRELVRFVQTRLESRQEAEEVAQESYARLLQLDQPEVLGFLRAYLFKTAAHLAIDRLRHRSTLRGAGPKLELSY